MNFFRETYNCQRDLCYVAAVAQLRLWLMKNAQGWQSAANYVTTSDFKPLQAVTKAPEKLPWQRFIAPTDSTQVRLQPTLPDRSVMSKPEERIELAPHSKGIFFVTIPLWLRAVTEKGMVICEYPTQVLSKTWFGHPAEEGETGYALATRARQNLDELTDVVGRVICPVIIENSTVESLVFSQLLLRVRHMGVYLAQDGNLWTNECRLGHKGGLFPSTLTFGRTAPHQAGAAQQLSKPREAPTGSLTARVFMNTFFKQPF